MVAKLVGAIVEHGEQLIAEDAQRSACRGAGGAARARARHPPTVPVPAALQRYQVESTPARSLRRVAAGERTDG